MRAPVNTRNSRNSRKLASLLVLLMLGSACAEGPALRGRMKGLSTTLEDAEKNGAMTCAPRELAVGKSELEFAEESTSIRASSRTRRSTSRRPSPTPRLRSR